MPLIDANLIVETGAGISNANSYATRAEATAYHTLRDNTDWLDADEHNQVLALIRATDYMDRRWRWVGVRETTTQGLKWPRLDVWDSEGNDLSGTLPLVIKNATIEYAMRISADAGRLLPDPAAPDSTGGVIIHKREKVGPIEEETRYSEALASSPRVIHSYPEVDRMLLISGLVLPLGGYAIRA